MAWRELLTIVRPDTLVRWHRDLYRLVWRATSRPRGRPWIPVELQRLISAMAAHPTAGWTIQQFRNGVPLDSAYRFVVHDRDGIFASAVDDALRSMSLEVLKTPVRAPQATAYCDRFIGTARRECLDWLIPLSERHLRRVLAEWIPHYNRERPHAAFGPGLPDGPADRTAPTGHRLLPGHRVVTRARLGSLHHDYRLESIAA